MTSHEVLNTSDHAELRVRTEAGSALGDAVMAALVVPQEFRQVQAHYPIVFRRDADGFYYFVGRTDDVFKSSDYRISPFELARISSKVSRPCRSSRSPWDSSGRLVSRISSTM